MEAPILSVTFLYVKRSSFTNRIAWFIDRSRPILLSNVEINPSMASLLEVTVDFILFNSLRYFINGFLFALLDTKRFSISPTMFFSISSHKLFIFILYSLSYFEKYSVYPATFFACFRTKATVPLPPFFLTRSISIVHSLVLSADECKSTMCCRLCCQS